MCLYWKPDKYRILLIRSLHRRWSQLNEFVERQLDPYLRRKRKHYVVNDDKQAVDRMSHLNLIRGISQNLLRWRKYLLIGYPRLCLQ